MKPARGIIPIEILEEYAGWGLCGAAKEAMGTWQYDDSDLEHLSLIMTLHDIGFEKEEVRYKIRKKNENKEERK